MAPSRDTTTRGPLLETPGAKRHLPLWRQHPWQPHKPQAPAPLVPPGGHKPTFRTMVLHPWQWAHMGSPGGLYLVPLEPNNTCHLGSCHPWWPHKAFGATCPLPPSSGTGLHLALEHTTQSREHIPGHQGAPILCHWSQTTPATMLASPLVATQA